MSENIIEEKKRLKYDNDFLRKFQHIRDISEEIKNLLSSLNILSCSKKQDIFSKQETWRKNVKKENYQSTTSFQSYKRPLKKEYHGRNNEKRKVFLKKTRMPDKNEKSKVLALLNKLGKENVNSTADKLLKILKEDDETIENLVMYLAKNTIAQTEIISTFALLWAKMFQNNDVKRIYMEFCRKSFLTFNYEKKETKDENDELCDETLEEFITDEIYNTTLFIVELYKLQAISWKPLEMMANEYILHLDCKKAAESLDILFEIMPLLFKKRYLTNLSKENQKKIIKDVVYYSDKAENIQRIHFFLIKFLNSDTENLSVFKHFVIESMEKSFSDGRISETLLSLAFLIANLEFFERTTKKSCYSEILSNLLTKANIMLEKHETVSDFIIIILDKSGKTLEENSKLIVDEIIVKSNELVSNKNLSRKWRFKFMDICDLKKRDWKPRK